VDRLGWTTESAHTAYGARIGLRSNDANALARIEALLPLGVTPTSHPVVDTIFSLRVAPPASRPGQRNFNVLYWDAAPLGRSLELEPMLRAFESTIQLLVAYWAADEYLFVHAGVVGWNGGAIVIPGRSMTGKTSLVAALCAAGATYYSDEWAIFDPQGRVHPYPRPLSIREAGGACRREPDQMGFAVGREPLPVATVVVTEYRSDGIWSPRTLSPARGLLTLFDNTVAARRHPDVSLPMLRRVAEGAVFLQSPRGEAGDVVRELLAR
jgi:hypothetical protein